MIDIEDSSFLHIDKSAHRFGSGQDILTQVAWILFSQVFYINLQAPVPQRSRNISTLVDQGLLAYQKHGSEVLVSRHFSQLVALDQTLFIDAERLVALFE